MNINVILKMELRRIAQDEVISHKCLHSLDDGKTLSFLANNGSIGQTPAEFSKERSFWEPINYVYYNCIDENHPTK